MIQYKSVKINFTHSLKRGLLGGILVISGIRDAIVVFHTIGALQNRENRR